MSNYLAIEVCYSKQLIITVGFNDCYAVRNLKPVLLQPFCSDLRRLFALGDAWIEKVVMLGQEAKDLAAFDCEELLVTACLMHTQNGQTDILDGSFRI